jgi:hypothetical protein
MSDDQGKRNALLQKAKMRMRAAGVELDGKVKWQVTKTHEKPDGFHFTCETPLVLNYPTPAGFDDWSQTSVGFTEVGEGERVHIDIGIETIQLCRAFIVSKSQVVGQDVHGDALRELSGKLVDQVKGVALQKGISLDDFGCRVIKVYDNRVEPPGFDFRCSPEDIRKLWALVKSLERFKFDDPEAKIEGGWFNQIATHGYGYREKGYGPRLHVEIDPRENKGNVHIDSRGFVREDGTYDWHEALTAHGPLDLVTGYVGGHVGPVRWQPIGALTYMRDRDQETTIVGLPDGRIAPPGDGGPDGTGRGWRFTLGIGLTW